MAVNKQPLLTSLLVLFLVIATITGCTNRSVDHWSEFVPEETPFILIPESESTISDLLSAPYMPLIDDMTPSAVQLISTIEEDASQQVQIESILFYTDTANDWQPIWVAGSISGLLDRLTNSYQKRFEQNYYKFMGHTVEKLFISDRIIFVFEVSGYFIFSESSLGIESLIRTIESEKSAINLTQEQFIPESFIVNTPSIENWVQQVSQVMYRPYLQNIFTGSTPIFFRFESFEEMSPAWRMTGDMSLLDERSPLLQTISSEAAEFTLDRYIPMNAASFSLHRLEPRTVPPDHLEPKSETDRYIENNLSVWQAIASDLDAEFAFATMAESGAESSSEYLYLRKIHNAGTIRSELNRLVRENLIIRDGNTYEIQSEWLGELFGSELNPMEDFYITIYNEVAALASRKGLTESIGGDANRRRVMYYDDDFMEIKNTLPESISSLFYMNAPQFGTFVQPWLYPQHNLSTLLSPLDQLVITTQLSPSKEQLNVQINSFERETVDQPYRERWIFPLGGAEITGTSVLADITGSTRNEIIFSTTNGQVYALASDGTTVLQVSTGNDTPIGSPVVYDWYGNNQNVILQAAGNKIYAWNNSGARLPNFPITLNETITTPLTVEDITRNGVAEMLMGTSDRRLHILNSRGQAINGWPQSTNAVVTDKPSILSFDGQRSIFTLSENALHSWTIGGERREGFPVFLPTQMNGAPAKFKDHIVGAGFDGNLYAIGTDSLFADSLSTTHMSDPFFIQSVQVSNTTLNATPSSQNLMLRIDGELMRDDFILVQAGNGSLFLYNENGELIFTSTMGQPASGEFQPVVADLERNQRMDLIALADFGRIYAWDLISGLRLLDLPTTGMKYPIIRDVSGDGNMEIIAQTRDGLRSWTILNTRREDSSE